MLLPEQLSECVFQMKYLTSFAPKSFLTVAIWQISFPAFYLSQEEKESKQEP